MNPFNGLRFDRPAAKDWLKMAKLYDRELVHSDNGTGIVHVVSTPDALESIIEIHFIHNVYTFSCERAFWASPLFKDQPIVKCECGAHKVRHSAHSSWCPMKENE